MSFVTTLAGVHGCLCLASFVHGICATHGNWNTAERGLKLPSVTTNIGERGMLP